MQVSSSRGERDSAADLHPAAAGVRQDVEAARVLPGAVMDRVITVVQHCGPMQRTGVDVASAG